MKDPTISTLESIFKELSEERNNITRLQKGEDFVELCRSLLDTGYREIAQKYMRKYASLGNLQYVIDAEFN